MNTFKTIMLVFLMVLFSGCAFYNYGNRDNEGKYVFFLNESREKKENEKEWSSEYYLYNRAQKYMNKSQEEILRIAGMPDKIINTDGKVFWMFKDVERAHAQFLFSNGYTQETILEFNKSGKVVSVEFFNKSSDFSVLYPNWISE